MRDLLCNRQMLKKVLVSPARGPQAASFDILLVKTTSVLIVPIIANVAFSSIRTLECGARGSYR